MTEKHLTYLNIDFKHEYWNQSNPELFNVILTESSQEQFRKLNILLRRDHNRIVLLLPENNFGHALLKENHLELVLVQRDQQMKNYTQLKQFTDQEVMIFHFRESSQEVSEVEVIPIKRILYSKEYSDLQNAKQVPITDIIATSPHSPDFARNVNALPDGIYSTATSRFYYQKKLVKNQFGIIQMDGSTDMASGSHTIRLKSRSLYLKYRVMSKNHPTNKLKIVDLGQEVEFGSTEVSENEIAFTSKSPLKIHEKSPYQFCLFNGNKKPLKEKLPLGATHNLKIKSQPDQFMNEIFIHV